MLTGAHDADLVALEGLMVASYSNPESLMLTIQAGNTTFRVRTKRKPPVPWAEGSLLAVSGICRIVGAAGSTNRDYNFRPESCEIWADSPDSIRVLSPPSWWTSRRISTALGMLIVPTTAALVWIFLLRRRVREQTAIIRAQMTREVMLEERQRIAREVHDTLEQELVGLALRLDAAAAVADTHSRSWALLETTRHLVTRIQASVRDLVWDLREPVDSPRDLGQSLAYLADEMAQAATVEFRVEVQGTPWPLSGPLEHNLLRIAQEALTNALKHARPRTIDIELSYEPEQLALRIRDDGRGFDSDGWSAERPGHFGLIGMRERARKIVARLELASAPERGTTVEVKMRRPRAERRGARDVDVPGTDHHPGGG